MGHRVVIGIWLLALGYFIFLPSFPPSPPSATGMIFFIAITALATWLCGRNLYRRLFGKADQNVETSREPPFIRVGKIIVYGLLTALGVFYIGMVVYVSLTRGISVW